MRWTLSILLAAGLGATAARAGWNTDAWPAHEAIRFADTSLVLVVTNVWAQQHREVWTQSYTWDELPAIPAPFGRLGYIAGATNAARTWTNEYLTDVQLDVATGLVASWGPGTTWSTNTHITPLGDVVTTVLEHYTNGIQTNLNLQVREIWAWDAYMAMLERWHAVQDHAAGTGEDALTRANDEGSHDVQKPRFYRGVREALFYTKAWLKDALTLSDWIATNAVAADWTLPAQPVNSTWSNLLLSVTQALAVAAAPTNYFDYTPWREVGGYGAGEQRVTTGEWVFVAPGTYTVSTVCGNLATQIVAETNAFPLSVPWTCTNESIAAGATSLEYGWKHVPAVLDQMRVTTEGNQLATRSNTQIGPVTGTNYADLAANWAAASLSLPGNHDYIVTADEWSAWRINSPSNSPIPTLCSRHEHEAALYVRPYAGIGNTFVDFDGLGLVETNWTTFTGGAFAATTNGDLWATLGTNYSLPHDAPGYVADSGVIVDELDRRWLIRWTFDYVTD